MKKIIIHFFITMMILSDERQPQMQFAESVPIVDRMDQIIGYDDESIIGSSTHQFDHFLLNAAVSTISHYDEKSELLYLNLNQFGFRRFTGFSRIIKKKIRLN